MLIFRCPKCGNYIQSNIVYVAGNPVFTYICNCGYTNRDQEVYYTITTDIDTVKDNRNLTTNHT